MFIASIVKLIREGKCQKQIKYQSRTFDFKGFSGELSGAKISLGEFTTELKNIDQIAETAKALDDFQFNLCNALTNPMLKENLSKEDLRRYTKALIGGQSCMLNFRNALEAFKADSQGGKTNLESSVRLMQDFVRSVTPELSSEESRNTVSSALASVSLDERDLDKLL